MTMKYILAFLSLAILASSRGEEVFQEFDEKIKEAYSEYVLEEHYDENYPYGIKLVIGNLGGKKDTVSVFTVRSWCLLCPRIL